MKEEDLPHGRKKEHHAAPLIGAQEDLPLQTLLPRHKEGREKEKLGML